MRTYFVSDALHPSIGSAIPIEAGSSGQARQFALDRFGFSGVKVWQHKERRVEHGGREGKSRVVESWECVIDENPQSLGATEPPSGNCDVCGEWQAVNKLVDGKRFCRPCLRARDDIPGRVAEARVPFRRVSSVDEARSTLAFRGHHKLHGEFFAWVGAAGSVILELDSDDGAVFAVSFRELVGCFFDALGHGDNLNHFEQRGTETDDENFRTVSALLHGRRLKSWPLAVCGRGRKGNAV